MKRQPYSNEPSEALVALLKYLYLRFTRKRLNLAAPKTFNEKMQWLKLYDSTAKKTELADKYLVRAWIEEKIGWQYLVPLLGVWDEFDEVDFDRLPDRFVLKANHGSGFNIIVRDKRKFDIAAARKKFKSWMATDYAMAVGCEMHYSGIKPKILAEEYIENLDGKIFDYRFMCFNGVPKSIWVDYASGTPEHRRNIYDANWRLTPFKVSWPPIDVPFELPEHRGKMMEFARLLCEDFLFVRVDFYEAGGNLYFGEMTFIPQSGFGEWESEELDLKFGDMLELKPAR